MAANRNDRDHAHGPAEQPGARSPRPLPSAFDRRAVLRGGLGATAAVGALALGSTGTAHATPTAYADRLSSATSARRGARAAAEPRIYTTAEWNARPPSDDIVVLDRKPTYIVVHHTAEPGNSTDYSLAHAKQICRDIQNFHMDGNGWSDTGQQFTNSRGGFVLEGRHKSLDVVRGGVQHVQGANVGDHNSEVIGIENEGLYTQVDVPAALWTSLVGLVGWIAAQYGTAPANIQGHRDFNSTECPGDVLYGRLQELRDAVGLALGVPSAHPALWPLLRPGDSGHRVRAAQHLLRAKGFERLPVDGLFGPATRRAVATLAERNGVKQHTCAASHHRTTDETGYLGSDIWPLLTPHVRAGDNGEVSKAVSTLKGATREGVPTDALGERDWKRLLA
ncbi:N-acetylmuramoyl-L-alanine amidase [Streptomyces sp. Z26]|uniref:peptidoglycan recognition protein family protein n=1 Tax=Streptomyces sp. Z26 TaxID=2500177 RepID=UPI000EF1709C|nr:N-acetylmuramoyl-L-alanine amidase [Streptomyces sp. Z26]RLL67676.1 N-acetylmuramoyl-L-alanine amidase [Streptomyces sp. Z26]